VALRNQLGQLWMNLKHARDQQGTLRRGHASHLQWVDVLEVDLDAGNRPAELELEDLQRAPPPGGSPGPLVGPEGVPLVGLLHRAQAQRNQFCEMR
jgi:hypothetical protein